MTCFVLTEFYLIMNLPIEEKLSSLEKYPELLGEFTINTGKSYMNLDASRD